MTADAVQAYVEGYLAEDDVMRDARARGDAMGCAPIGPGGGAGASGGAAVLTRVHHAVGDARAPLDIGRRRASILVGR